MKQIDANDVVLFDNALQLLEYERDSGDTLLAPDEWKKFPRIQSKHRSFHCGFNNGNHF
jgi:hypothetical protein